MVIMLKKGFTLAEVLITLAIIGVVAAISIPSVISNSQQQEFKTGLKKAVSVLNSAITMNMALDGETPYDNSNLFGYLMKHMAIIESGTNMLDKFNFRTPTDYSWTNAYFYTTDGMRFEFYSFNSNRHNQRYHLYENSSVTLCVGGLAGTSMVPSQEGSTNSSCGGCGSFGLNNNVDGTTRPPCLIMVDVNGDRKPSPTNVACKDSTCANSNLYKFSDASGVKLSDLFSIMITDREAVPYGAAAQRAMYNSRK
ncbi:MAG: type II secretion system protein [bacterium]|nr:type II secretion system protein [bacterium]